MNEDGIVRWSMCKKHGSYIGIKCPICEEEEKHKCQTN